VNIDPVFSSLCIPLTLVTISLARSQSSGIAASFPLSHLGQPSNLHAGLVSTLQYPHSTTRTRVIILSNTQTHTRLRV